MAFNAGQCLLVAHVISNNTALDIRDRIGQWFSTSRAAAFTTVEVGGAIADAAAGTQTSFSSHSVIQYDGGLFVSFPAVMIPIVTGNALYRVDLPSASTKLSSRVSNLFDGGGVLLFAASGSSALSGDVVDYNSGTNIIDDADCSVGTAMRDS
jgi:hypothetical protein